MKHDILCADSLAQQVLHSWNVCQESKNRKAASERPQKPHKPQPKPSLAKVSV